MILESWHGRRVFLTGHTGFKGAWLSLLLTRLGAKVEGYSLPPPTTPSLYAIAGVDRAINGQIADIRDADRLLAAMRAAQPEVVFHLAAQSLVRRSYREPGETFSTNVSGTVNVLEAVRANQSVRAVVIVTTDKVYDLSDGVTPRRETDKLGGKDPYSASKAAAELVAASYRGSYFGTAADGHPALVATARSGNVIGGGDWSEDRIVTDIVAAIGAGRQVELRYPDAVRPWMYVLDSLSGYMLLADRLLAGERDFAEAWNFGPSGQQDVNVRRLVEIMAAACGQRDAWRHAPGTALPEAAILRLDPGKAHHKLGWRPTLTQEEAIAETAAWFNAFMTAPSDAQRLCSATLDRHLEALRLMRAPPEATR